MKKYILALVMLCFSLIPALALADEVMEVNVPPTRVGAFLNVDDWRVSEGALWELLKKDRLSLEGGVVDKAPSIGLGCDVLRAEDYGWKPEGWLKAIKPAVGVWLGYDIEKGKVKGGGYLSIIKLEF